jgi:putative hydroxymethylpyrimidine transport system substrate-binding protein
MGRVTALLAVVLCGATLTACGDDAEPGAPTGATLVLDFQPNAVHSGIYAAEARGYFSDEGLDLDIREPSSSADSAKLLEAGRADFAVMDINDFGIARDEGLDIAAIAAVVQRPLASVIAADGDSIRSPADLEGATVGVTGVPSDDAVLDTVLADAGLPPEAVKRQTIGFQAVPLLAAGQVDAATAFWNAEGVQLRAQRVPTGEFRVDEFGAPRYPELVIATGDATAEAPNGAGCGLRRALQAAYAEMGIRPSEALSDLLSANPELDADTQNAQLEALMEAGAFSSSPAPNTDPQPGLDPMRVREWAQWARDHGVIENEEVVLGGFPSESECRRPESEGFDD